MKRIVLIVLVLAPAAFADNWTTEFGSDGNRLLPACKATVLHMDEPSHEFTKQDVHNIGYCLGFVSGIADSVQDEADLSGTNRDQLVRVVEKYLENHPEDLSKAGSWLVRSALVKAFPKSQSSKQTPRSQ